MTEMRDDDGFVQRTREVGIDRAAYELMSRQDDEQQARVAALLARRED